MTKQISSGRRKSGYMKRENFEKQVLIAESSLYRVAKSILGRDEDCADAIQSGILKAYRKLDTLRNDRYFKTWLTRIVINECYEIIRDSKRYVSLEEYMENGEALAWESQEETGVFAELMAMDEKYRLPIVLYEIEGYSTRAISVILGLTETNVRNRLSRGRAMLRDRLKGVI